MLKERIVCDVCNNTITEHNVPLSQRYDEAMVDGFKSIIVSTQANGVPIKLRISYDKDVCNVCVATVVRAALNTITDK
jgi:hypothetical protein